MWEKFCDGKGGNGRWESVGLGEKGGWIIGCAEGIDVTSARFRHGEWFIMMHGWRYRHGNKPCASAVATPREDNEMGAGMVEQRRFN